MKVNLTMPLHAVQAVEMHLDAAVAPSGHATARTLLKAVEGYPTDLENNRDSG